MLAVTAHGPSAWWYATRGAGATTLVLLTAAVVLGIAEVGRWQPLAVPRFGVAALHRTISLLALSLLVVHVLTTLVDPFPRIGWRNAVLPFATSYRPLWIGLGTLAADLLIAVALTSLVRRRLGFGSWRAIHWLSYACWPIALLHGLGAGSDAKATWMLALTAGCVAAVSATVVARVVRAALPRGVRAGTLAAAGLGLLAATGFALQGPLAGGWARRAGTPAGVLAAFGSPAAGVSAPATADGFVAGFAATVRGPILSGSATDGTAVVDLPLQLSGGPGGRLRIRLAGQALTSGGLRMTRSAVTLGSDARPEEYRGRVRTLSGQDLEALVGSADGRALRLRVHLSADGAWAQGSVRATAAAGAP